MTEVGSLATPEALDSRICPACGEEFGCGAKAGSCWCEALPRLPLPAADADCLCSRCLAERTGLALGGKP